MGIHHSPHTHTHTIPIPMGIPMGIPITKAALPFYDDKTLTVCTVKYGVEYCVPCDRRTDRRTRDSILRALHVRNFDANL